MEYTITLKKTKKVKSVYAKYSKIVAIDADVYKSGFCEVFLKDATIECIKLRLMSLEKLLSYCIENKDQEILFLVESVKAKKANFRTKKDKSYSYNERIAKNVGMNIQACEDIIKVISYFNFLVRRTAPLGKRKSNALVKFVLDEAVNEDLIIKNSEIIDSFAIMIKNILL